jgi:serpin B
MSNIYKVTLIILAISSVLFAQDTTSISKLVSVNNDFGFRLFSELVNNYELTNILISPASITMALDMTYNGANCSTKEAMATTLGIDALPLKQLNKANKIFKDALTKADPTVTINIANSLWADIGTKFKSDFIKNNKTYYNADLATLNFSDVKASNVINNWVNKKTKGKINKIINEIGEDVIAYLINAIYFNGKWQTAFDASKTKPAPFYQLDGNEIQPLMMTQSGKYLYLKNDMFQAIRLPYGKGQIGMYLFLPDTNLSFEKFLVNLDSKNWSEWVSSFTTYDGTIKLPRFKIEYDQSLKETLIAMGMDVAFDDSKADFTKMATSKIKGNIFIGDVKHKTFIEVNEQGTEAAAVTSVQMELKGGPAKTFEMTVNRPFFYIIDDNKTGAILFIGIVTEPK